MSANGGQSLHRIEIETTQSPRMSPRPKIEFLQFFTSYGMAVFQNMNSATGILLIRLPVKPHEVVTETAKVELFRHEPQTPPRVLVLGEVKKPGCFEFKENEPMTLLNAIARAQGWSNIAFGMKIWRIRDGKGLEINNIYKFDVWHSRPRLWFPSVHSRRRLCHIPEIV